MSGSLWRLGRTQAILVLGALLNAVAFFAVLPFAPLYLADRTSLSASAIGLVVGGIAFTASVGGVLGGALVDRFGAVRLMTAGLAGYVVVYTSLTSVRGTFAIVLLLSLGVFRLLLEPGGKKLLSQVDDDGRLFRLRYMAFCMGGIVGPAVGGVLYTTNVVAFFLVPAAFYAGYLVLLVTCGRELSALDRDADRPSSSYALRDAARDRRLLAAVGAGLTIFFVFSQLESMLPLIVRDKYGDAAGSYFAALFIANAVLALALQPLIYRASRKVPRGPFVIAGCAAFALSFACFWAGQHGLVWYFAGIALWTLGEGVLLPMPDIAVHEIAEGDRKGVYFGIAELRYLGFFLGPLTGGLLLDSAAPLYFTAMALVIFACVPLLLGRFTAPSGAVPERGTTGAD
ncbi:MFS transporter [Saccharothrix xinjiangensis]|uniref:MFS transporter n=1 Tax=Saccharothrix xinjiangensis TaxID=204798 RepID=A0ABV9YI64_9PSEU